MREHRPPAAFSYLLALAVTALAVALRWLLDPWLGDSLSLVTLFGAVAASVWFGGYRPAVVAALTGYLACSYLFIEPRGGWALARPADLIGLLAFLASCAIIIGFGEARRRARWAGARSEDRFRELGENIPQLAWMTQADGWIFWYNRRWFDYTGTTLEQMQGWGWKQVHHPDHVERVEERFRRALATGEPWEDTFPLRAAEGGYRWFLSRAFPIRDASGAVTRWFGTNTDITDLLEAQEALRESQRRKDEFLATLAHELRNPLAPIRNAVEVVLVKGSPDPDLRWAREVIDRQVRQMARLLDDLLDVSRISHNKLELRREGVELAAVVRGAIETSRPLFDGGGLRLTVELPSQPIHLEADPVRLAQVFSNLLSNAAKYTEAGGHVRLTGERRDGEVVVTVADDGIGIAPETLPRIFEMFSQETAVLERSQGGLGIGLSLVRRLVELHGGTVTAHSDGPGRGSAFVVRLPASGPPPATRPRPDRGEPYEAAATGRRLLVVDDRRDSADSLALLLQLEGHEVHTAYDGEEAVAAAARLRPEAILLDIGMPKLNGYEACRRIRCQPGGGEVVVIALTGWGQDDDRRKTAEAGFDHHLVKPVDPEALRQLIASLPGGFASAPAAGT